MGNRICRRFRESFHLRRAGRAAIGSAVTHLSVCNLLLLRHGGIDEPKRSKDYYTLVARPLKRCSGDRAGRLPVGIPISEASSNSRTGIASECLPSLSKSSALPSQEFQRPTQLSSQTITDPAEAKSTTTPPCAACVTSPTKPF